MKFLNFSLIVFTIFIYSSGFAQEIPNNSFENWDQGNPVDWWGVAILQVSDAYEGNSAVSMQILDDGSGGVIIPVLAVGDVAAGTNVSQRYGSFGGYYKFNPNGSEWFNVGIVMNYNNMPIGAGAAQFSATAPSTWTEFSVPITYTTEDTPDHAILTFNISNASGSGVIGSNANVDYVSFGAPTNVEHISGLPGDYSLKQNYPNPFNPTTNIEYSIPEASFVQITVYDVIGNEVATLVNEEQAAGIYRVDFNAVNLTSGMYLARITANDFTQTVKMTLLK